MKMMSRLPPRFFSFKREIIEMKKNRWGVVDARRKGARVGSLIFKAKAIKNNKSELRRQYLMAALKSKGKS